MSAQRALELIAQGLALRAGVCVDDPYLHTAALGCLVASDRLYQVAAAGFGSVRIFFDHHQVSQPPLAFELSDSMPPELRSLQWPHAPGL